MRTSQQRSEAIAILAVLGLAAVIFASLFNRETALSYSIGYNLYGAQRVLAGEIPYLDFHTLYPPGTVYLNAVLFKMFGPSLYTALFCVFVFKTLTTVALYLGARQVLGRAPALVAAAFSLAWLRPAGPFKAVPMHYGALFLALALYASLSYFRSGSRWRLVAAGASLGVLTLFKHNIGGYALLGVLAVITVDAFARRGRDKREVWRDVSAVAAGFLIPLVPVAGLMASLGAFGAMTKTLLFGPGEFLLARIAGTPSPLLAVGFAGAITGLFVLSSRMRSKPFLAGTLWVVFLAVCVWLMVLAGQDRYNKLLFFLPALIIAGSAVFAWRGADDASQRRDTLMVAVVAAAAYMEAFPRFAREQVIASMPFVGILLVLVAYHYAPRLKRGGSSVARLSLLSFPFLCLLMGGRLFANTFFGPGLHLRSDTELTIERGRGVWFPKAEAEEIDAVVGYIRERVPEGGFFFAESYAGSSYLFLADRRNPSAAQFWGGVGVSEAEKAETLRTLDERKVGVIVASRRDLDAERYQPMRSYIERHFAIGAEFGDVLILERKVVDLNAAGVVPR
jgi:4-amino-4-deoxy-L-arabinose transferase-like glycosyltransferase